MFRICATLLSIWLFVMPAAAQSRAPLVLAAASLQEAMTDAADAWASHGNVRPKLSFAASSALARQVMAGARADLFVSADGEWMDAVAVSGMVVRGTRGIVARGRLVAVTRADGRSVVSMRGDALARTLGNGPLAMADPDSVPAGRYGRAALQRLGAWDAVASKVVRAENVRAALALVTRGAAPYGIVYETDARAERGVRIAGWFPPGSHPPIVYPIARLTRSTSPDAERFRRFLLSSEGRAIFLRRGFGAP